MPISQQLRNAWRRLRWNRVDEILFECLPHTATEAPSVDLPLTITKHTATSPTGVSSIDSRIGDRWCYIGWIAGEVAHTNFVSFNCRLPGQFGFDRNAPVLCDGFTKERFRGHRIQSAVLHKMTSDLFGEGHARVYTLVAPDNAASLRGITGAGFVRVARLRGTRFLGFLIAGRKMPEWRPLPE